MYKKDYPNTTSLIDLKEEYEKVLVTIKYIKEITTKTNDQMAFVTIYDGLMQMECYLFPSKFFEITTIFNEKAKVKYDKDIFVLELKQSRRNDTISYEIIRAKKL